MPNVFPSIKAPLNEESQFSVLSKPLNYGTRPLPPAIPGVGAPPPAPMGRGVGSGGGGYMPSIHTGMDLPTSLAMRSVRIGNQGGVMADASPNADPNFGLLDSFTDLQDQGNHLTTPGGVGPHSWGTAPGLGPRGVPLMAYGGSGVHTAVVGDPQRDGLPNPEVVTSASPIRVMPMKNDGMGMPHMAYGNESQLPPDITNRGNGVLEIKPDSPYLNPGGQNFSTGFGPPAPALTNVPQSGSYTPNPASEMPSDGGGLGPVADRTPSEQVKANEVAPPNSSPIGSGPVPDAPVQGSFSPMSSAFGQGMGASVFAGPASSGGSGMTPPPAYVPPAPVAQSDAGAAVPNAQMVALQNQLNQQGNRINNMQPKKDTFESPLGVLDIASGNRGSVSPQSQQQWDKLDAGTKVALSRQWRTPQGRAMLTERHIAEEYGRNHQAFEAQKQHDTVAHQNATLDETTRFHNLTQERQGRVDAERQRFHDLIQNSKDFAAKDKAWENLRKFEQDQRSSDGQIAIAKALSEEFKDNPDALRLINAGMASKDPKAIEQVLKTVNMLNPRVVDINGTKVAMAPSNTYHEIHPPKDDALKNHQQTIQHFQTAFPNFNAANDAPPKDSPSGTLGPIRAMMLEDYNNARAAMKGSAPASDQTVAPVTGTSAAIQAAKAKLK